MLLSPREERLARCRFDGTTKAPTLVRVHRKERLVDVGFPMRAGLTSSDQGRAAGAQSQPREEESEDENPQSMQELWKLTKGMM